MVSVKPSILAGSNDHGSGVGAGHAVTMCMGPRMGPSPDGAQPQFEQALGDSGPAAKLVRVAAAPRAAGNLRA